MKAIRKSVAVLVLAGFLGSSAPVAAQDGQGYLDSIGFSPATAWVVGGLVVGGIVAAILCSEKHHHSH